MTDPLVTDLLAGVPFVAVAHHDLRMFRTPGVYVLARRAGARRRLLYVGQAEQVSAAYGGRAWASALEAGLNEALVNLTAAARLDRLQIAAMIVRAYAPPLNEPGDEPEARETPAGPRASRPRRF